MKLRDLLKVTATGQEVIVRLMFPSDYEDFDYETELDFYHFYNGSKLAPAYIENGEPTECKHAYNQSNDVLNIFLKMNVKQFYSDVDFGKTEYDDYAPIGDYDIRDRIIVELEPITTEDLIKLIPKKFDIGTRVPNKNYVTRFDVFHNHKHVIIL